MALPALQDIAPRPALVFVLRTNEQNLEDSALASWNSKSAEEFKYRLKTVKVLPKRGDPRQ